MSNYSIQDVAHLSGIKPHTIRIWEQRYKLIEPKRTQTNIRTYNDFELKKILAVSLLLSSGHKISKVAKFSETQLVAEINNLQILKKETSAVENSINQLINAMIDFDEEKFDKLFTASLLKIGFEKTITQIIYPFLDRVGLLWGTNKINPAQEHFISNLIRNKIIAASETEVFTVTKQAKFILFLPSNEYHELALLLANFTLKAFGFKVIYLGANVPATALVDTLKQFPKYNLFTHITFPLEQHLIAITQQVISKKLHNVFYVSGNANSCLVLEKMKTVTYFPSLDNLKTGISLLQ